MGAFSRVSHPSFMPGKNDLHPSDPAFGYKPILLHQVERGARYRSGVVFTLQDQIYHVPLAG